MILCGLCAGGRHAECSGFLRALDGFCGCFDRGHDLHAEPVPLDTLIVQLANVPAPASSTPPDRER